MNPAVNRFWNWKRGSADQTATGPENFFFFAWMFFVTCKLGFEQTSTKFHEPYAVGIVSLSTTTICQRKFLIPIVPHRSSERRFRVKASSSDFSTYGYPFLKPSLAWWTTPNKLQHAHNDSTNRDNRIRRYLEIAVVESVEFARINPKQVQYRLVARIFEALIHSTLLQSLEITIHHGWTLKMQLRMARFWKLLSINRWSISQCKIDAKRKSQIDPSLMEFGGFWFFVNSWRF